MNITGIIAEYNPFHNGHAYQLARAREETGADYIIVVMSGNYVQRGAPALLDKYIRAEMALMHGADLVLELPVLWSCASAQYFAGAGVSLLHQLGCVSCLCYGCETPDSGLFHDLCTLLDSQPAKYRQMLTDYLKAGNPYALAREKAAAGLFPSLKLAEIQDILRNPNNILALEYQQAIAREASPIKPYPIKRIGAGYHSNDIIMPEAADTAIADPLTADTAITDPLTADAATADPLTADTAIADPLTADTAIFDPLTADAVFSDTIDTITADTAITDPLTADTAIFDPLQCTGTSSHSSCSRTAAPAASATAIRSLLQRYDHAPHSMPAETPAGALRQAVPPAALRLLLDYRDAHPFIFENDCSQMLHYCLIRQRAAGFQDFADCSEDLSNKICRNISQYTSFKDFCGLLKSKDLAYTRISRCLLHILLDLRQSSYGLWLARHYMPYARVLGFRRSSGRLLTHLKQHSALPLLMRASDAKKILSDKKDLDFFEQNISADHIYRALAVGKGGHAMPDEYHRKMLVLP